MVEYLALLRHCTDATELRELILENPDLPLIIFCGDDVNNGDYCYMTATKVIFSVEELTLYNEVWMDRDEYSERLAEDIFLSGDYKDMSDEAYDRMIDKVVEETSFIKAIVVYCNA